MKQKREIVIKEVTSSHDTTIILDQQLRYINETEAKNLSTLNLGCHILVSLHHLSSSSNNLVCVRILINNPEPLSTFGTRWLSIEPVMP
jgi:hypothetical protein